MASNSFGNIFKITTWGESHGKAIGVVIDGCPAGLEIDESEINAALALRAPGRNPYTSPGQKLTKRKFSPAYLKVKQPEPLFASSFQIKMPIQANMSRSKIYLGRDMPIIPI